MSSKKAKKTKHQKVTTRKSEHRSPTKTKSDTDTKTTEMNQKIELLNKRIIEQEQEKTLLQSENELLKNSLVDATSTFEKNQKIIFSMKKEMNDLLQDLDTADVELEEYLTLKSELSVKNENLQRELIDKERLLETRNHQFEKLAQDYEMIYKKLINEEKQAKTKKTSKKTTKRVSIDSLAQLQEQIKTIEKLEKKLKSKDEEIDELINRLEIQEIKIEELEEEIENELKNRVRLEKAYNKIKSQA